MGTIGDLKVSFQNSAGLFEQLTISGIVHAKIYGVSLARLFLDCSRKRSKELHERYIVDGRGRMCEWQRGPGFTVAGASYCVCSRRPGQETLQYRERTLVTKRRQDWKDLVRRPKLKLLDQLGTTVRSPRRPVPSRMRDARLAVRYGDISRCPLPRAGRELARDSGSSPYSC